MMVQNLTDNTIVVISNGRTNQLTHLEPEEVFTTLLLVAPCGTAEVVTKSPSEKFGEPEILPLIDPSGFCFQLDMTGTPGGAFTFVFDTSTFTPLSSASLPPKRFPSEIVVLLLA